jgi:hypothetical protein
MWQASHTPVTCRALDSGFISLCPAPWAWQRKPFVALYTGDDNATNFARNGEKIQVKGFCFFNFW